MSLEQLVFIALFILVPLVRTIVERRNKQRQEEEAAELFETTANQEAPSYPSYEPPAWSPPPYPAPAPAYSPPPPAPVVVAPVAPSVRPPPPPSAQRPVSDPARILRTARARTREAVPRSREELRRAFLLVEILGPPRALQARER
jgi:hypothetical protein